MTDYANAENLRREKDRRTPRKNVQNICRAHPNWNGCDYCDVYGGYGLLCWKQDSKHKCVNVEEVRL